MPSKFISPCNADEKKQVALSEIIKRGRPNTCRISLQKNWARYLWSLEGVAMAIGQLVRCSTHISAYLFSYLVNGNGPANCTEKTSKKEKQEVVEWFCTSE